MRNLKRALSLVLASIMVIGMMVTGASAATSYDDFSDKDKIVNTEAVSVLNTLGVLEGRDGAFDPTGIVTRGEMAKIICVILNGGTDPKLGNATTNTYTDTANHWASAYIEYCTNLGIVSGKGNGTFAPNATVTGTEAAKMLLVALGYNATYENMVGGSWVMSTNVLANQNKLYSGLDINPNEGMTRDSAAQMSYNAINAEMVIYTNALVTDKVTGALTSIPTVAKKDTTLLSEKFGGVRVEGVVVRNEHTAPNFDGKTRLDVTNEDELDKVKHDFGDVATFNMTTDASMLGTSVFMYVVPSVASPRNSEKAVVLGDAMDSSKNVTVSTTKTFGDDKVAGYMKDNDIAVNADTVVYVDGSASGTGIAAVAALVNQTGSEVKFIDNDNDGVTEAVVKTNYGFGKVTKYSTKDDGTLTIDTYTDSKDFKSAKIMGFDEVALNDYVVYNEMGGKLYVAKAETVTGNLETFKANSNRLKANLTVDGTAYTFSESGNYRAKDGVLKNPDDYLGASYMGKQITLYMDKFGFIAAASDVQGFTDYAYIANASVDSNASGYSNAVRVYASLADGTTASYMVSNLKTGPNDIGKRPTTVNSGSGSVVKGNVYGYYVTSDGQIELTEVTNGAEVAGNASAIRFDKNASTIDATGLSPNMTDNSTVFFYVMKDATGNVVSNTVKRVDAYVGKDNAPSINVAQHSNNTNASVKTVPSRANANIAGAVVFEVAEVASANVLYLYQYVKSNNENTIYNAVINGELVEGITVDSRETNMAGSAYVYTMTTKGYYNVSAVSNASMVSGYVTLADSKSVVILNPFTGIPQEVKITSDTSMAEIDGGDTAIITNVTKKDWVTAVFNPNTKDAMGIYLEERFTTSNTSILGVDGSDVTESSTPGFDYDVAVNGKTAGLVISKLALSNGASAYVTYKEPTTLALAVAAADAIASATTLVTDAKAYIVVLASDNTSYNVYDLKVGAGNVIVGGGVTPPTPGNEVTITVPVADYASPKFYLDDNLVTADKINTGLTNYTFKAKTGEVLSVVSDELAAIGTGKYARVVAGADPVTLGASKEANITITGATTLIAPVQMYKMNTVAATHAGVTATATPDVTYAAVGATVTYTVAVTGTATVGAANDTITLAGLTNLTGATTLADGTPPTATNCSVATLVITIAADSLATSGTFTVSGTATANDITPTLTGAAV